jgi:hypothetical protein
MFLIGTTPDTRLSIATAGGTVPGTTFDTITSYAGLGTIGLGIIGDNGTISVQGALTSLTAATMGAGLRLNVTGDLALFSTNLLGSGGAITVGGSLSELDVNAGPLTSATVTAGSGIGYVVVYGSIENATILANGTAGIAKVATVAGNLSGTITASGGDIGLVRVWQDANVAIKTPGRLLGWWQGGSTASPTQLSGSFDVKTMPAPWQPYTDLQDLTIRCADPLGALYVRSMTNTILSSPAMSSVQAINNFTDSKLLAGYDIGADLQYSTGDDGTFGAASGNMGWVSAQTAGGDNRITAYGTLGDIVFQTMAASTNLTVNATPKSLTVKTIGDNAQISVQGSLSSFTAKTVGAGLGLSVTGNLGVFSTNLLGSGGAITVGGSLSELDVNAGPLTNATVTAGSGIGNVVVYGNIENATILANGAAGIAKVAAVGGNLSGSITAAAGNITKVRVDHNANVAIKTPGTLGAFLLNGSSSNPIQVSGSFDVKAMPSFWQPYADLVNLTVRCADPLGPVYVRSMTNTILCAGALGNIQVVNNLTNSKLLSGYDIGADLLFGTGDDQAFTSGTATGNIGAVTVGGNMSGSSIAANVSPGADGAFGTADDVVLSASLQGAIASLTVGGTLTGSTNAAEHFGVVAHQTIGPVKVGGVPITLPWTLGNITIAQSIT